MLLGEIIKQYRKEHGMSLQDFANLMGTSKSYIHMLEKNLNPSTNKPINPSIETLKTLSSVMDIDLDLLLKNLNPNQEIYLNEDEFNKQFEENPNFSSLPLKERLIAEGTYNTMHTASVIDKKDVLGNPVITIPILGTVKAGYDYLAQENWIGTYDLEKKLADTGDFFALRVKGNSMSPNLLENDIVIIKKQDDFIDGNIVVALINGDEATIKVAKRVKNGIKLIPINLAEYEPLFFTNDEIKNKPVRIIGVVKKMDREF